MLLSIDDFIKFSEGPVRMKNNLESLHEDLEDYAKILNTGLAVLDGVKGVEKEKLRYKTIRCLIKRMLEENGGYVQYVDSLQKDDYIEVFTDVFVSNDQFSDLNVLLKFILGKTGWRYKSFWTTKTRTGHYKALPMLDMFYVLLAKEELDLYNYFDTMDKGSVEPLVLLDYDEVDNEGGDNQKKDEGNLDRSKTELNYDSPRISLQQLLKKPWFNDLRSDERYDSTWTDAFIEALMRSEYADRIARDWAVSGLRGRKNQLRGYVVGLLKDAGVLKGSYHAIASKVGILVNKECDNDPYKTFADYMARGKKQPYAGWVMEYVGS